MKMSSEIKLTISENEKLVRTVTKTVEKQQLVKTLEDFQIEANAALTKMIEELGDISAASGVVNLDCDDDDESDDDFEVDSSTDNLQMGSDELKGHSKSKKKKHC